MGRRPNPLRCLKRQHALSKADTIFLPRDCLEGFLPIGQAGVRVLFLQLQSRLDVGREFLSQRLNGLTVQSIALLEKDFHVAAGEPGAVTRSDMRADHSGPEASCLLAQGVTERLLRPVKGIEMDSLDGAIGRGCSVAHTLYYSPDGTFCGKRC